MRSERNILNIMRRDIERQINPIVAKDVTEAKLTEAERTELRRLRLEKAEVERQIKIVKAARPMAAVG